MHWVLRPFSKGDKGACVEAFASNIPKFFFPHEQAEFETFLDQFSGQYLVIASKDGRVVACGGVGFKYAGDARLCFGLVHHDFHKLGLGKLLLLARLDLACLRSDISSISLDTSQYHPPFFEKFGFISEGQKMDYYGPGMHRHDMRLTLNESSREIIRNALLEALSYLNVTYDRSKTSIRIRAIDPNSSDEIDLVATRMRQTLVEVLGEEKGGSMYSPEWLRERVLFHLDPKERLAQIFLSENPDGHITGHAIVRIDHDKEGHKIGFFSTLFVEPEARKQGVATGLLARVEEWLVERNMNEVTYYTAQSNKGLIDLFCRHGYKIVESFPEQEMVQLKKPLVAASVGSKS